MVEPYVRLLEKQAKYDFVHSDNRYKVTLLESLQCEDTTTIVHHQKHKYKPKMLMKLLFLVVATHLCSIDAVYLTEVNEQISSN